jgi:hypothetical protein
MISPPMTVPYLHRVARGLVPGAFFFDKFGLIRQDNDSAYHDIWQYGSDDLGDVDFLYPLDGTAPINRMSSTDPADDFPIFMIGLDINGEWVEQVAVLDGQNPVTLGTPLWRCFTAFNIGASTSPIIGTGLAGNVHWYNNAVSVTGGKPDTAADTKCFINNGRNRTLQAFWTSPVGYTSYIIYSRISLVTKIAANCQIELYLRPYGGYPQVVDTGSIGSSGTSVIGNELIDPVPLEGGTDFIPRIQLDTNDTSVSFLAVFLLIQNGYEHYS